MTKDIKQFLELAEKLKNVGANIEEKVALTNQIAEKKGKIIKILLADREKTEARIKELEKIREDLTKQKTSEELFAEFTKFFEETKQILAEYGKTLEKASAKPAIQAVEVQNFPPAQKQEKPEWLEPTLDTALEKSNDSFLTKYFGIFSKVQSAISLNIFQAFTEFLGNLWRGGLGVVFKGPQPTYIIDKETGKQITLKELAGILAAGSGGTRAGNGGVVSALREINLNNSATDKDPISTAPTDSPIGSYHLCARLATIEDLVVVDEATMSGKRVRMTGVYLSSSYTAEKVPRLYFGTSGDNHADIMWQNIGKDGGGYGINRLNNAVRGQDGWGVYLDNDTGSYLYVEIDFEIYNA